MNMILSEKRYYSSCICVPATRAACIVHTKSMNATERDTGKSEGENDSRNYKHNNNNIHSNLLNITAVK